MHNKINMADEDQTNRIQVKIVRCRGLQGSKGGHLTTTAKVEFGGSLLGESPKVEISSNDGFLNFDFSCNLSVCASDPLVLDEIAQTPIVVTFNEILPKDKKAKEEKTNVLGQCCIDLLPLLRGDSQYTVVEAIHPVGASSNTESSEVISAEVEIVISSEKPLLTEDQLESCNLLTVCIESAFSLPESWNQTGAQHLYAACLPIPLNNEKETMVLIPNGVYRGAGEKEHSEQRRWSCVPSASGSCLYIPNTEIHHCPYEEENGDLKKKEDVEFRQTAEKNKPHVTWNAERRCFLSTSSSDRLQQNIAQFRRWPLEIIRTLQSTGGKTKGKEEEASTSYHGVGYIDLAPLIYPGVKKIRGAYFINPYSESEMQAELHRRTIFTEDVIKNIVGINRSNSSLGVGKGMATKLGKNDTKAKPSIANVKADVSAAEGDTAGSALSLEGQEYVEARSYIIVEIELEKPLVQKRQLSEVSARVAELIPPRPSFPKKQGGSEKAIKDFESQIGKTANMLLEEFRKMYPNSVMTQKSEDAEERRRLFYYQLNTSGKYFALKEQIKYFVIKIVREKFMYTMNFENHEEMQAFITKLYLFLLDHMHLGLNNFLVTEETAEVPPPVFNLTMLKQFAEEAEKMFRYDLAAKYYQERIARNKNDPDCHLDYGIFCLLIEDGQKAEQCFREVVSIQQQHLEGILLCALMCLQHEEFDKAEDLLDGATYIHPEESLPLTLLGLFYSGVENNIMAERSFNAAVKFHNALISKENIENEEDEQITMKKNKKKDDDESSIFIEATKFLLRCHLLQLSERALAHELTSKQGDTSVMYLTLLAELQIKRKQYECALESLQQAIVLKHENPAAWALKGHVCFILKDLNESKNCYERCLAYQDICSDVNTVYLRLASIYLEQKLYDKAKKSYLYLCKYGPSCVSWLGTGIACYRMGQLEEAEYALNEANILDNHNADVWSYLTLVSLKSEKYTQSEQCYNYSVKVSIVNTLRRLGWNKIGNIEESLFHEVNNAMHKMEEMKVK